VNFVVSYMVVVGHRVALEIMVVTRRTETDSKNGA
jgi:hypothetical protein